MNRALRIYPKIMRLPYDAENRQLSAVKGEGTPNTFTYDAEGFMTSKRYANGEMERYQYDGVSRRIRMDEYGLDGVQKSYTAYTYDANGNRTGTCTRVPTTPVKNWEETNNTGTWGGENFQYEYDVLNRLTKETQKDTAQTVTYTYDCLGNRLTQNDNRNQTSFTYNELNQLVQKKDYNGITTYTYDGRGNRTSESSQYTQENRRTYEWDSAGRLVKGTRGPDYGLYTSAYTYNGLGMRVESSIMGPDKTVYERDYVIDYTSPERNDLAEYTISTSQWQGTRAVHELNHLYDAAGERL